MTVMILGYDAMESYHPLYVIGGDTLHYGRLVHTWYREPIVLELPDNTTAVILVPFDSLTVSVIDDRSPSYSSDMTPGPNPFEGDLMLDANDYDSIRIYDAAGRFLFSWPIVPGENLLDTSGFMSGVYFFKFERAGITRKLVKVE